MRIVEGNIWDFHKDGNYIGIPTNGMLDSENNCIMGKGVAYDAVLKFPDFPKDVGKHIWEYGNIPYWDDNIKLFSVPTKHHWKNSSELELIQRSCELLNATNRKGNFYIPLLGCGYGRLKKETVMPLMAKILDDRFILVLYNKTS